MLNTTTAGNFHPHNDDAFDIVICNDLGKLFSVVHIVQLWASNQRDAITDKIVVEILFDDSYMYNQVADVLLLNNQQVCLL